jgi:hypothetical protein
VALDTTNNQWVLKVAYIDGFESSWKDATIAGVVIAAFFLSMMVLHIIIAQTQYRELLFKMMPASYFFLFFIFYSHVVSRASLQDDAGEIKKFSEIPFTVILYSECTLILTFEDFYLGQCYRKTKKGADCD